MTGGEPHARRPAEIMQHKRDALQIKRQNKGFQIVDVILEPIAPLGRRLALPEAHVIRDDHAVGRGERLNEMAKQVAPGRFAVQAEHDLAVARALVDILHPEPRRLGEVRSEGKGAVKVSFGMDHDRSPCVVLV